MRFNVIGYGNQILGQVEADNSIEAWGEAGKQFTNILDVRLIVVQEVMKWKEGLLFEWYSPAGERVALPGQDWENDKEEFVAVTQLTRSDFVEDLREDLEPYEYSGVLELNNIIVMVGDVDGYHYVKAFPSLDAARTEAQSMRNLIDTLTYSDMEESEYFSKNGYIGLSRGGA